MYKHFRGFIQARIIDLEYQNAFTIKVYIELKINKIHQYNQLFEGFMRLDMSDKLMSKRKYLETMRFSKNCALVLKIKQLQYENMGLSLKLFRTLAYYSLTSEIKIYQVLGALI